MIVRKLRLDRGWSQEQLASISGVSVRTIQRIENGGRASLESLKCLAAAFETTIPQLREGEIMSQQVSNTSSKPSAESNDPEIHDVTVTLSAEDLAALRYARRLREYDDWYDDEDGWGDEQYESDDNSPSPERSYIMPQERKIRRQVRRERAFYRNLAVFAGVILFLALINMLTNPGKLWFLWVAGLWGIGLIFHALDTFGTELLPGRDWERRQVERRLNKLANPRK